MSTKCLAVVTGGAMGIGRAIADRLAAAGARVVIADRDAPAAMRAAGELRNGGGDALALEVDVADPASIERFYSELDREPLALEILVNNAGVASKAPFRDFPLAEWNRTLAVNLTGTFLMSQAAARRMMRSKKGRIVNIATVSALRANEGRAAYAASKGGVISLTRQMAFELAPHGIRVNAVAPGPVDTPLTRTLHSARTRENYLRVIPLARYGTPEEIAAAVAFLASEESAYVTGHVLDVDGGFMAAGIADDTG